MAALTGRALIASRCAKFFKNGDFVNLGIGVPLLCVNYLPEGVNLWLEAEIGTVGRPHGLRYDVFEFGHAQLLATYARDGIVAYQIVGQLLTRRKQQCGGQCCYFQ